MNLPLVSIDIETGPDPALLSQIPPPEVAYGNLVDPIKRKAKEDAAAAKQIECAALDPHFARVLCVAYAWHHPDGKLLSRDAHATTEYSAATEPDPLGDAFLVREIANLLSGHYQPHTTSPISPQLPTPRIICTFNGSGFDLPFIYRRAMIHGISTPRLPIDRKCEHADAAHIDAMRLLNAWETGNNYGTNPLGYARNLDFYAAQLLGDYRLPLVEDKAHTGDLWNSGPEGRAIVGNQCRMDAERTLLLATKAIRYYT